MKLNILIITLFYLFSTSAQAALPIADSNSDETSTVNSYKNMYSLKKTCPVYDPYEKLNRAIYKFNATVDYLILRPIAKTYDKITNDYTKARVGSFINNVGTPLTMVNYGFQLDYNNSMKSFWRFMINTTFGVCGLFDVASKMGLEVKPQTFGNTLAHYGVAPGPYIVLPLLGSTTMRDITDPLFTNNYLNPVNYAFHRDARLIFMGGKIIHERANLLPFTDYIMENSSDSYIAVRSSIYQNREANIRYPENFVCPKQ